MLALGQFSAQAQNSRVYKYWVEFTDKQQSPYRIDNPSEFLSARALERRTREEVSITEQDFPVNQVYISTVAKQGLRILNRSRWFNAVSVETTDSSQLSKVRTLPFVKQITLLGIFRKDQLNKDAEVGMMDYLLSESEPPDRSSTIYGAGWKQIEMIKGHRLHEQGYRGEGIYIAVLDAGFLKVNRLAAFDSLRRNNHIIATWDFVEGNSSVFEDDDHGLNVLSCMATNLPDRMIGTAPAASYMLLRSEDAASEYPIEEANWVSAAEYADSAGADIINSSLGYTQFDDHSFGHIYEQMNGRSTLISRAADIASSKGILMVNAAGNEGDDNWKYIGAPADVENVLTVGAVDQRRIRANFSSIGPTSDGRIKPDLAAMGMWVTVISPTGNYHQGNGTSYASPILCGAVACLKQANPTLTNAKLVDAVLRSCDRWSSPDNKYGHGIPDMELAHTFLGNNKSFDYKTDQLVKSLPDAVTDILPYCFYTADSQKVVLTIRNQKGREVKQLVIEAAAGSFQQGSFTGLSELPTGNYYITFALKQGAKEHFFLLEKR